MGHPEMFGLIRTLVLAASRCAHPSAPFLGRSPWWLPAWLPGHPGGCAQRHNRKVPRLVDVIAALASVDPAATIYVSTPAEPDSAATVCVEPHEGGGPAGLAYLLEVRVACDVLDVWARWRDGKEPTPHEAARAVIYYAQHDAYEPQ